MRDILRKLAVSIPEGYEIISVELNSETDTYKCICKGRDETCTWHFDILSNNWEKKESSSNLKTLDMFGESSAPQKPREHKTSIFSKPEIPPLNPNYTYVDKLHFIYPPMFSKKTEVGYATVIKDFVLKLNLDMEGDGDDTQFKVGYKFKLFECKGKYYVLIVKRTLKETYVTLSKEHFR